MPQTLLPKAVVSKRSVIRAKEMCGRQAHVAGSQLKAIKGKVKCQVVS